MTYPEIIFYKNDGMKCVKYKLNDKDYAFGRYSDFSDEWDKKELIELAKKFIDFERKKLSTELSLDNPQEVIHSLPIDK